jgi:SAM-dependent methyltransferase
MAPKALPQGDSEFYEGQDLEALEDLPHYYRWILKTFGPYLRGRVLEVGAGTGNFTAHYVGGVREAVLLEPARNLYPLLASRFAGNRNVVALPGLLEEYCEARQGLEARSFDAAVLVNVLEHVEDDQGMLRRLGNLLRPGGALLVFVPAVPWLYGTLDSLVHHYRRYSFSRLARTTKRAGLELVQLRYFDVLGVLPWFVTGRILKQRGFDRGAAVIYDRFVVPLASRLERWVNLPLGKNLICVARRPQQAAAPVPARAA